MDDKKAAEASLAQDIQSIVDRTNLPRKEATLRLSQALAQVTCHAAGPLALCQREKGRIARAGGGQGSERGLEGRVRRG